MLGLILLVATLFRGYGLLTWDDNTHQHPDERFLTIVSSQLSMPSTLADYFNTPRSSINPYANGQDRYAYGQLPLTLTRWGAEATGRTGYDAVYGVGRVLSALADLASIGFAWLLARDIFDVRVAHLTALLLSLSVLDIQLSHFFAVDTYVAGFAAASLYFGHRAWTRDSLSAALLAGVCIGMATACKISALILLPVLGLALIWPRRGRPSLGQVVDGATAFGLVLVGAVVAFRIAEPYAFVGPAPWNLRLNPQWIADKVYWAQISSGTIDVPYMIQWTGTPAYTFVLQNIVQWAMGPALGLTSLVGLVVACWRLLHGHTRERDALLIIVWTLLNLVYFGGQFAKFLRYLLPAYTTWVMLGAYGLVLLTDAARRWRRRELRIGQRLVAPLVVAITALWACAFSIGIYGQPHSRIQASDWIYATIPAGATIATEHWDDRLPLPLAGHDPNRYRYAELALYDAETSAKRDKLEATLDRSQYIVMASRKLVGSIPKLPERYPLATRYYALLESGQLGFQRINRFEVKPELGPFSVDDSLAQEDFTVYDHPLVDVYQKRPDYSSPAVHAQLDAVPLDRVVNVRALDGGKGALLMTPAEAQAQATAGTWSTLFDRDAAVNALALPVWLIAVELIALSAVPLLWRVLAFLPDRGFGASKIVGLALVSFGAWWVASLKLAPFERPLLVAAWLALALASVAAGWGRRGGLATWLRREARLLIATEAVFLAGFALFAWLRAANPDLWHPAFGGEKPMNFAYLNAVIRSEYFPPYDPWFSGGIINYYYFGFVLVAVVTRLTAILPEIAFNLAEPTLYGALCAGLFSLAFALSVPWRGHVRRAHAYVAGGAAVALGAVLGNLDAGLQVLDQLSKIGGLVDPQSSGPGRLLSGLLALQNGVPFPMLDFWRSTRFIGPEDVPPIHEFPYFTFLYGDLHAHQIALPITVAVLLIGLNAMRGLRADPRRAPWASIALAGVLVGMLRATNTWDFPTYAGVTALTLVLGSLPALLRLDRRAIGTLALSLLGFGALVQLSFAPYLSRYQLFYTGVDPVAARTAFSQYLTIHGLFLFLALSLLAWYAVQARRRVVAARREASSLVPEHGYYGTLLPMSALNGFASPAAWIVGLSVVVGLMLWVGGYVTRGFIVLGMGFAAAAAVAHWRRADRALQAALVACALFATLIPEVVALQGDIGRMNTVFKFYMQGWVLLSIASAVALSWLARRARVDQLLAQVRPAWLAVALVLVLAAAAYPLLASKTKISMRFTDLPLSLDGMDYLSVAQYRDDNRDLNISADAHAIRWLQTHIVGTPVVLEGRSPVYRWGSRISIYTGLPTILGWDVHQSQQRSGYAGMIQDRATDVERLYSSTNSAQTLALLRKYQVRYVVVGGLERAYYPAAGLEKLRSMPELRLAYDVENVQIYEVLS